MMCTRTMHEEEKLSLFAYKQDFFCSCCYCCCFFLHSLIPCCTSCLILLYVSFICDNCLLLTSSLFRFPSPSNKMICSLTTSNCGQTIAGRHTKIMNYNHVVLRWHSSDTQTHKFSLFHFMRISVSGHRFFCVHHFFWDILVWFFEKHFVCLMVFSRSLYFYLVLRITIRVIFQFRIIRLS